MSVIVPDSITPYSGYKYLRVFTDGALISPQTGTPWPPGKPLEARCTRDFGWHFTPRPYEHATQLVSWKRELSEVTTMGTATVEWLETTATLELVDAEGNVSFCTTIEPFNGPPTTILPPGMAWSYERRPCPHEPVAEDCSCGIYAVNTPKQASDYRSRHQHMALVRVALWGRVIQGDKGARGQYAYPTEVLTSATAVPPPIIRERYHLNEPFDKAEPTPEAPPPPPSWEPPPKRSLWSRKKGEANQ